MNITDLEKANPQGRIDVLAYRGAEQIVKHYETQYGISGIWDAVKPHVHHAVVKNITGANIPPELEVIFRILHANWGKIGQMR